MSTTMVYALMGAIVYAGIYILIGRRMLQTVPTWNARKVAHVVLWLVAAMVAFSFADFGMGDIPTSYIALTVSLVVALLGSGLVLRIANRTQDVARRARVLLVAQIMFLGLTVWYAWKLALILPLVALVIVYALLIPFGGHY